MAEGGSTQLRFPDFSRTVNLVGTAELAHPFARIMRGWRMETQPASLAGADMTFRRAGEKYDWIIAADGLCAKELSGLPETACDAASDFHYELYRWYRAAHPRQLCLHAAACRIGAGAVLFPSTFHAGKSVLAMALAERGVHILGDDVVALDTASGELVALGLLPRLRLPLPEAALGPALSAFIRVRQGLTGRKDAYVDLEDEHLARLGDRCPVRGVVVLDRSEKYRPAKLAGIGPAEAMRTMLLQNFNTRLPVRTIFDTLKSLLLQVPLFRLSYSHPTEAAALLARHFGNDEFGHG